MKEFPKKGHSKESLENKKSRPCERAKGAFNCIMKAINTIFCPQAPHFVADNLLDAFASRQTECTILQHHALIENSIKAFVHGDEVVSHAVGAIFSHAYTIVEFDNQVTNFVDDLPDAITQKLSQFRMRIGRRRF